MLGLPNKPRFEEQRQRGVEQDYLEQQLAALRHRVAVLEAVILLVTKATPEQFQALLARAEEVVAEQQREPAKPIRCASCGHNIAPTLKACQFCGATNPGLRAEGAQ